MAQFEFGLQTVLEQREREERFAQQAYAQSRQAVRRAEQELAAIEQGVRQANDELRASLVGRLDATMLTAHRRYIAAMRMSVVAVAERVAQARQAAEQKRRDLSAAVVQRKAIESLRDKQESRWSADQDRKEQALADDVAVQIAFDDLQAE